MKRPESSRNVIYSEDFIPYVIDGRLYFYDLIPEERRTGNFCEKHGPQKVPLFVREFVEGEICVICDDL